VQDYSRLIMETPHQSVITKLSRLRLTGITEQTKVYNLSTAALVLLFYELAERWDVSCCVPNCTKTKDRYQCVKHALRSMDAIHLQPSIKELKGVKKDGRARKVVIRALQVMLENLESRFSDLYTKTDWPKPQAPEMEVETSPPPPLEVGTYNFSPDAFGANDIPPISNSGSNTSVVPTASKENVPLPLKIHPSSSSTPLSTAPADCRNSSSLSSLSSMNHAASKPAARSFEGRTPKYKDPSKQAISTGFFPTVTRNNSSSISSSKKSPPLRHMFSSKEKAMDIDEVQVGKKRSRRISDVPNRKKASHSTDVSSEILNQDMEESPTRSRDDEASSQSSNHHPTITQPFHRKPKPQPDSKQDVNMGQAPRPKPVNRDLQKNLSELSKQMTQTIEVVGIHPRFLHSIYGREVRRVLGLVFARLQDYDVQDVPDPERLLWKIKKPIPKQRWQRVKATVKEAARKISNCIPPNLDPLMRDAVLDTVKSIDINDHEFS